MLFFKGRRNGFMPEYLRHPVRDRKTWEEDVKWRLDPNAPGRFDGLEDRMRAAAAAARAFRRLWIPGSGRLADPRSCPSSTTRKWTPAGSGFTSVARSWEPAESP